MPLLANINVGSAPNDGTGDTIRNAFITVNENFQFIEAFFPNTDVANLTANITSTGISTFNTINAATVGNAGTAFTGASISAATIGNTGAALVASTVSAATIGNAGTAFTGASISSATIGNAGTAFTGASISAASLGNVGSTITGTLLTNAQPYINTIGEPNSTNISIQSNIISPNISINSVRSIQYNTQTVSPASGSYNLGMIAANGQTITFHMNGNVAFTLVGTITQGIYKDLYFINNTGTTQYANIFAYSNRTNKGTNSIAISNNIVAKISMLSTDTTEANIIAIVANT